MQRLRLYVNRLRYSKSLPTGIQHALIAITTVSLWSFPTSAHLSQVTSWDHEANRTPVQIHPSLRLISFKAFQQSTRTPRMECDKQEVVLLGDVVC